MNLLGIETATSVCSVALWMHGRVVVEFTLNRPRAHSENLVPLLADVLHYGGLKPADVDVVAVSSGPGSYTGLRIGAGTAKGLSAAVDAALVAVPSLEALAFGSRGGLSEGDVIIAAFDARRDEVFAAAFRLSSSGDLLPFRPTSAVRMENAVEWIGEIGRRVVLVGDGGEKLLAALGEAGVPAAWPVEGGLEARAASVARLGAERFARGEIVDRADFEPYYLKDFVAKMPSASAFEKLPF